MATEIGTRGGEVSYGRIVGRGFLAGGGGGALTGALVGSAFAPGVGTLIGAIYGAVVGLPLGLACGMTLGLVAHLVHTNASARLVGAVVAVSWGFVAVAVLELSSQLAVAFLALCGVVGVVVTPGCLRRR